MFTQPRALQRRHAALRGAAVSWLVAGSMWLAIEAFSAAAFPAYSYARSYISDLGVPPTTGPGGQQLGSPRHAIMNFNFIVHGLLFLLGGILVFRATAGAPRRARFTFLALAIIYAIGSALVGTFHGSAQAAADGTSRLHVLGAGLSIVGGNAAIITAGLQARRSGASDSYCTASVTLGALGLLCLIMLQTANPFGLTGVWERGAVYSITLWEIVTGVAILSAERHRASAATGDTGQALHQPTR